MALGSYSNEYDHVMDTNSPMFDWLLAALSFIVTVLLFELPGGSFPGDNFSAALYVAASKIAAKAAIQIVVAVVLLLFRHGIKRRIPAMVILFFGILCGLEAKMTFSGAAYSHQHYLLMNQVHPQFAAGHQIIAACRQFAKDDGGKWPDTLDVLAPDYIPAAVVQTALSGNENVPGYRYIAPSKDASPSSIVLISKTAVFSNQYLVCHLDGRVGIEKRQGDWLFSTAGRSDFPK
jgi:hypothetical protein